MPRLLVVRDRGLFVSTRLALKLPLPEAGLLDALAEVPESACLRSFLHPA
jgi:hypothetical protein